MYNNADVKVKNKQIVLLPRRSATNANLTGISFYHDDKPWCYTRVFVTEDTIQ